MNLEQLEARLEEVGERATNIRTTMFCKSAASMDDNDFIMEEISFDIDGVRENYIRGDEGLYLHFKSEKEGE